MLDKRENENKASTIVRQELNSNLHKLVLSLLLVVGKILPDDECRDINALCLGITPVFSAFLPAEASAQAGIRRKITSFMYAIT